MSLPLPTAKKSAARFSLPVAVLPLALVSPLLLSAARPPALDSISATCSLEEARTYTPEQTEGANVSFRRETGGQIEPSAQSEAAENEFSSFVRDRWNSVRRLIRENPYFTTATPEQQAEAEAFCLAQIRADYEVLLAQAGDEPMPIEALPDLGNSPAPSSREVASPAPVVSPNLVQSPPPERPASEQPAFEQPVPSPEAVPTVDPATLPTANDPSIYMGPEGNPTPFDGIVVRTLADMPDGNYRYIAGAAEERAYSNEELRQRGGSVFVLKKVGNTVTGDLLPRIGLPGICVTGTVSGDVITGAAYPYDTTDSLQDSGRQIGENYEPHGSGALKIRRTRTDGNQLYYAGALLDLTAFTPINAGSSLPPTRCQVGRTGGRDQG